jgi:hypothetical protein
LPRILACYTLYEELKEQQQKHLTKDNSSVETMTGEMEVPRKTSMITTRRVRYFDSKKHAMKRLQPIQTILDALVDLEWNLLDEPGHIDHSKPFSLISQSPKQVHFAAFDGSSLCPPTDVTPGSYRQQEKCIRNLIAVLNAVDDMRSELAKGYNRRTSGCKDPLFLAVLQNLVLYLDQDFRLYYHDKICARSISPMDPPASSLSLSSWGYPTRRVEKAAACFSRDFESLLALFRGMTSSTHTLSNHDVVIETPATRPLLSWEYRLADVSSQLVRYWLRTLLNPVPVRAKIKNKTDRWNIRIAEIVTLIETRDRSFLGEVTTDSDDESSASSTAVEDGSLSSLLSDALSHIYHYLGGIPVNKVEYDSPVRPVAASGYIWRKRLRQVLPDAACLSSDLCIRGLGTGRQPTPPLIDTDWRQVGEELQVASDFVAFFHRLLFLEQLVSILVTTADWALQWENTVQTFARILMDLHKTTMVEVALSPVESTFKETDQLTSQILQQEDCHLILLAMPLTELLTGLQELLRLASDRYSSIKLKLQQTVSSFRFGKSNTKHKKQYQPQLGELEEYWNELLEGVVFPSVVRISKEGHTTE